MDCQDLYAELKINHLVTRRIWPTVYAPRNKAWRVLANMKCRKREHFKLNSMWNNYFHYGSWVERTNKELYYFMTSCMWCHQHDGTEYLYTIRLMTNPRARFSEICPWGQLYIIGAWIATVWRLNPRATYRKVTSGVSYKSGYGIQSRLLPIGDRGAIVPE